MTHQQLIAALNHKDFESASLIAKQLGKQALLDLQSAPTDEARSEIYKSSTAIISDALHLARVLRSHIASELYANSASFLYRNADLEQAHWQIKA